MIPELWNELGTEKIGDLNDCLECFVEEERNGIFELTLDFPNGYPLSDQLLKERIIVVNANDTLLNQKFRIYDTKKFIDETIAVFARHISFDLMYDYVGDVTFENQSCEYALNSLFRQSQFSTHYKGYSDIVNAQNYSMSMCNILEAIGGKEGSIIDTFGTGAEILRDNTDIHVLNARGHDNDVTIEYGKNLTGFELSEDTTDLVTRILPYAKYTPEGGKETTVKGSFIDSPLINNYSHPYIKHIDYSDRFEDKEIPTKEKLETFARNEYRDNKVDIPKTNFKIEFIPLSKCVGYEDLEDKISICDKVTIKNTRYNVDTKAKVIKYKFDVLRDRYESMELGEPRTTLGDVIGNGKGDGQVGPPGPQGPPGANGNIGDFPNSLPQTPILTATVKGFSGIDLSWTYEDKVYYTYEVYASKTKDFKPNTFDLIHEGQTSSYLFQAKPNETWYFRVCAKNTHGERTDFSPQVTVNTVKGDNLSNYFTDMAIGKAVVNSLTADYMEAGIIKGNWIDMRLLTLTDGNGKRVINVDDFGRAYMDLHELKIQSKEVGTKEDIDKAIDITKENLLANSNFVKVSENVNGWGKWSNNEQTSIILTNDFYPKGEGIGLYNPLKINSVLEYHSDKLKVGGIDKLTVSFDVKREESVAHAKVILRQMDEAGKVVIDSEYGIPELHDGRLSKTFNIASDEVKWCRVILHHGGTWQDTTFYSIVYFNRIMISIGDRVIPWKVSYLDQLTDRYSKIESDMNQINLEVGAKVNSKDIISAINLSPEKIKIESNNIDISGVTTMGNSSSGQYVTIENEDYSVYNGNIRCLHFGYMNWQGREGLPEFLMGANGMNYNAVRGDRSGNYFGMASFTREKNPNSWDLDYQCIYYKRAGSDREIKIEMAEDGRMRFLSEHSMSFVDQGYGYLDIRHGNGGLIMENGFTAGKYDRCTFLKDIVVEGGMTHNDMQQGVCVRKYWGSEYTFRPTTTHAIDLGTNENTWRNLHYHGQLIYHGLRSSSPLMLCRTLEDKSHISQSTLTYEDYFNYIKDTNLIEHSRNGDTVITVDYYDVSDADIRDKYMKTDDSMDQTALLGVQQAALKEACLKISELEETVNLLVKEIKELKGVV